METTSLLQKGNFGAAKLLSTPAGATKILLGNIMTKEDIKNKILELKKQIQEVHGSKCEVYSRVVGYLRPVQGWNRGKKEEFAMRKHFNVEKCGCGD